MQQSLARQGFHGIGLAELLSKAETVKGAMYHHFPGGKTELAQAAIEATLELRVSNKWNASDVKSIRCLATPLVLSCLPYDCPVTPAQAQFSMPFAIACAALYGEVAN